MLSAPAVAKRKEQGLDVQLSPGPRLHSSLTPFSRGALVNQDLPAVLKGKLLVNRKCHYSRALKVFT